MKRQDDPNKQTQTLQELQREKLKLMEYFCAWLDAGKSLEELGIMIDIPAAAGQIPEYSREVCRGALEIIRQAREEGADHNDVLAYLKARHAGLSRSEALAHFQEKQRLYEETDGISE